MKITWLTAAGMAMLCLAAPLPGGQTASPSATPQRKAKKQKAPPKKKKSARALVPSKPPADIPEVKEAASVWRGCLESRDLPVLAAGLGVEESRLKPLLGELNLLPETGKECVQYVAATGGEGGAASAIFERPEPKPDEAPVLDIRKTVDGITVTPGACDCPKPARRVLDVPFPAAAEQRDDALSPVPANVRWQLETLMPRMICNLAQKRAEPDAAEARADGPSPGEAEDEGAGPYTMRIALARRDESQPEQLQSVEIVESASGKRIDGVWWLDRPGGPGALVGMNGVAYERLLWQSPVKYIQKTRGVGPQTTTFRRRVPVPKGKSGKPTMRTVTVREYHLGADLMAPKGTEVHAVGEAKVSFAGRLGGFGKLIILDHGLGYQTYYAHLSVIKPEIKVGASVARGDVIGLVGSTGHSTAPHLHFETRKDAKFIDPFDDTRQLEFWLLTPDDQERLAMEMLAPNPAATQDGSGSDRKAFGGNR